jgi:hypothetical protein
MPLQYGAFPEAFPQESDAIFEHRTGAAVKELDGRRGELRQQRAGSVAKKKNGPTGGPFSRGEPIALRG